MKRAPFTKTPRSTVRRLAKRASYDRAEVYAILDEGMIGHVAVSIEGQPFVLPMAYARRADEILLHGSAASRLMKAIAEGAPLSLAVTHLDGVVVARSAFHSSMNYRSVVVFGTGKAIEEPAAKRAALDALVDHLIPGRSAEARPPSIGEMKATMIVAVDLEEASAKVRVGPPADDDDDYDLPIWGGVIPLRLAGGDPFPDGRGPVGLEIPASVERLLARINKGA
jgi:hypothetical protein